jgi:hypothetical protein
VTCMIEHAVQVVRRIYIQDSSILCHALLISLRCRSLAPSTDMQLHNYHGADMDLPSQTVASHALYTTATPIVAGYFCSSSLYAEL